MNATVRLRTGALMPRLDALEEGLATGWDPRGLVMLLMALGFVLLRLAIL